MCQVLAGSFLAAEKLTYTLHTLQATECSTDEWENRYKKIMFEKYLSEGGETAV